MNLRVAWECYCERPSSVNALTFERMIQVYQVDQHAFEVTANLARLLSQSLYSGEQAESQQYVRLIQETAKTVTASTHWALTHRWVPTEPGRFRVYRNDNSVYVHQQEAK